MTNTYKAVIEIEVDADSYREATSLAISGATRCSGGDHYDHSIPSAEVTEVRKVKDGDC